MKILIVAPHFHPMVGGVENYVLSVIKAIEGKYEVVVVTAVDHGPMQSITVEDGIKIYRLKASFRLSNTPINLKWIKLIKDIIRNESPDIINTHSPVPFMADIASAVSGRVPVVCTYHAGSMIKHRSWANALIWLYERLFLPRLLNKSKSVIAIHPEFVKKIIDDETKVVFIPPGIDTDSFKPDAKVSKQYDVAFVGRIDFSSEWKGLNVMLKALREVAEGMPKFKALIVGDGDALHHYEAMSSELKIAQNVDFVGALQGHELVAAYNSARIVILPSTTDAESFGMVLAEAMSCEIPVIASRIGGVPNVIDDKLNGLLISPSDPVVLSMAIVDLLADDVTRKLMGVEGRKKVVSNFSKNQHEVKTLALFDQMLINESINRKCIVQVAAHYPPYLGGMEQRIKELSEKLSSDGCNVLVLTSDQGSHAHTEKISSSLSVKYLPSLEIAHTAIIPRLFLELFRIPKNSIVHVHIAHAYIPEIVSLVCRLRNIPYISHIRLDVPASGTLGKLLLPAYKKYILGPAIRKSKKIIVLTDDYVTLISNKYSIPKTSIHVIPNATQFKVSRVPKTLNKEPHRLLFVGRLSSQKNIPLLLEGLSKYVLSKERNVSISLSIVGEGELRDKIQNIVQKLSITEYVQFLGRLDGRELERAYENSDVFILTSTHESFGTVLIEAMSKALPVIATDIDAVRNTIVHERNGLLIDQTADALARALNRILNDEELYASASLNNLNDLKKYSWDTIIKKTMEVYSDEI